MHTFWTTFYSYKGGVGRSMALANVAASLAKRGRRVMMIDFDLEAPGLDSFEEFGIPREKVGMVEYVCHYLTTGGIAPIEDHVHEIVPMNLNGSDRPAQQQLEGKLWLMTSGAKNDSYNEKRLSINWADLYENHAGADFFDNFKAEIEEKYRPDYVLVDSRTGLTDVGGVCTLHLPDLVFLLFSLNEQNLQGIASVARVLRDSEKFPQIIPVATPVPNLQASGESLLDQRFQRARELLGTEVTHTLPYSPIVALKEKILVWGRRQITLGHQYGELADALQAAAPAGLDFLLREAEDAVDAFDSDRAEEIGELLKGDFHDRADAWLALADIAKSRSEPDKMEEALYNALGLSPSNSNVYRRLSALLKSRNRHEELIKLTDMRVTVAIDSKSLDLPELLRERAELLMKFDRPKDALSDCEKAIVVAKEIDADTGTSFVDLFNLAEARRRASGEFDEKEWELIVRLFETSSAGTSALPAADRANRTQAMHIAYACAGNLRKARNLLIETEQVLSQASRQERVFSVADYDFLPLPKFLARNQEMLIALEKGELWDGMKVD